LSQQAAANQSYVIQSSTPGTVVITLPASMAIGETVSVTGQSANNWTIAQNAGQSVVTANLAGNVAPGTVWMPRLAPKVWHWLSSDSTGNVLLAGEANGLLSTSADGGLSWTTGNSTGGIWIASDMTPRGEQLFAAQYGGGLYRSTNLGATWTRLTSANSDVNLDRQSFEAVSVSADGQRIVTSIQGGFIYVSANGGQTWARGTIAGTSTPVTGWWRGMDSSADGLTVVSTDHNGELHRSLDGGFTWSRVPVVVDGAAINDNWYRVRMSDDGSTIALVGNSFGGIAAGTGIYVSRDRGATWIRGHALVADYTAAAMSGDGKVITVSVSNPNPNAQPNTVARATGRVLRSVDGGVSFTALPTSGNDTNWRAVATSADGNKTAVAAGLFDGGVTGQLHTSLGNRTSVGTLGSIGAVQGQNLSLVYQGSGQFNVTTTNGGDFTIR
jgi:hypothetical protein